MRIIIAFTTAFIAILYCKTGFAQYEDTLIRVYRYYISSNNYVTVADDEYTDSEIANKGWLGKECLFYGYHKPGPERIGIYSWFNPAINRYISIAEDEFTDDQMKKNGYFNKHFQFYALTRRGQYTMAVYRWWMTKHQGWVTIPEYANVYSESSLHHKTYQYYAIAATDNKEQP
jgi:hypothetical protein